jgi:hypothetical protein
MTPDAFPLSTVLEAAEIITARHVDRRLTFNERTGKVGL